MAFHTVENIQLLEDLVPAGLCEVITAVVEELLIHRGEGSFFGGDFVSALVHIDSHERFFCRLGLLVCVKGMAQLFIVSEYAGIQQHVFVEMFGILFRNDYIRIQFKAECLEELLHLCVVERIFVALNVQRHADRLEKNGGEHFSSAVDRAVHHPAECRLLFIGHEFEPGSAARNQFTGIGVTSGALFGNNVEVCARGTDNL